MTRGADAAATGAPAAAIDGGQRSRGATWRRASAPLALALLGACAYFNGVYNAKESTRTADKLARRGHADEATGAYATAAQTAETVLARYPRSRWRSDALYLAGRGEALSGRCDAAVPRLTEYLAAPKQHADQRARATVALGGCYVEAGRYTDASRLLEPLVAAKDRQVARDAARLAARAAGALGRTADAERFLGAIPRGEAEWELAATALARQDYARAESLLVLRARQGDYRESVVATLQELWAAKRYDAVDHLVNAYAQAKTPAAVKTRLHMFAADLLIGAGRDREASEHLLQARRLTVDSLVDREASARLTGLGLAALPSLVDVEAAIARGATRARGSAYFQRLRDNLLLMKILLSQQDVAGSSLFLAGEVARDSLRARTLARDLFVQVATTRSGAPIAAKAWLAAADLSPDSATAYREIVRTRYAGSPYAFTPGDTTLDQVAYVRTEDALKRAWDVGLRMLSDSLRVTQARAGVTPVDTLRDSAAVRRQATAPPGSSGGPPL